MHIRSLVPALAAVAAIPATQAFEIAGDGWTFALEPRIQTRIEFASATNADDSADYDIWAKQSTDDPQTWNFNVRRARLYMKGKSDDGWFFGITLRSDKLGRSNGDVSADTEWHDLFVGKAFDSGDMSHNIKFGFDEWGDYGLRAVNASSSKYLFPTGRLVVGGGGNKTVGLGYELGAEMFGVTVAVAESDSKEAAVDDDSDLFLAARVSTSLKPEWAAKRTESFLGKEGFGHELGLAFTTKDTDGEGSTTTFGIDYLVHWNQISGIAEITMNNVDNGTNDTDGMSVVVQGGYAIPLQSGSVVEPAARLTLLDNDTDNDDEAGVLTDEGGMSGMYIDLGVNYYLAGHKNKFQAGIQIYSPEEGDGSATAVRLAHQIDF